MTLEEYLKDNDKTHLIFDYDNTLFKPIYPWVSWHERIEKGLTQIDKEIIRDYLDGKINLSELQNLYIAKYGEPVKKRIQKHNIWFETHHLNLKKVRVNNELIKLIPKLTKYKKYIWSSNTKPAILEVLKFHRLSKEFEKVITGLDVDLLKPDAEGFFLIYNPQISKDNYLLIGDSGSDQKAAKNAGIDFFHIDYFGKHTLKEY